MSTNQSVEHRAEQNTNLKMLNGIHMGQVKWFNRRRGYGFIKIIQSRDVNNEDPESFIGKDVFVHQSHIKPQKSSYRSLEENEYVELSLSVDDKNVTQAVNVTGILGGSLLCDVHNERSMRQYKSPEEGGEFSVPKYNQKQNRNRHFHSNRDSHEQESNSSENRGSERGNYFSRLSGDRS
jgi:cold shock CspA family protein